MAPTAIAYRYKVLDIVKYITYDTNMFATRLLASLSMLLLAACAHRPAPSIFLAAERGDVATLRTLLLGGAGPNQRDARGLTALILAARAGSVASVRLLLTYRADPNLRGGVNNWTPLMHAVHKDQAGTAQALLEGGAQADSRGKSGETALMMAAGYGYTPIVELLLDRGADPRAATSDGYNVLAAAMGGTPDLDHFTMGSCHADTIQALKRKDPTLHLPDNLWARVAQVSGGLAKLGGCAYR